MEIHVWGGLGSQLFAINLVRHLQEENLGRRLRLVLHTSGVTRREPENSVVRWFGVPYRTVDDYVAKDSESIISRKRGSVHALMKKLNTFAKLILVETGVCLWPDTNNNFKVFPWTLQIRGHYSYIPIHPRFLKDLRKMLNNEVKIDKQLASHLSNATIIHYRLGDLLEISEKGPIPARIISQVVLGTKIKTSRIYVVSDSNFLALTELISNFGDIKHATIDSLALSPVELLFAGSISKSFVGTNSKLSLWISILRVENDTQHTFLSSVFNRTEYRAWLQKSNISFFVH